MDIISIINKLKEKREIFHSEADFQFALAWEIQEYYPEAKIRLEYCPAIYDPSMHIDIMIIKNDLWYPIEVKYFKKKINTTINEETFILKEQSAQDLGRYDFLKDIMRIEKLLSANNIYKEGYAIVLTNDPSYWKDASRTDTNDAMFRITEDCIKTGTLTWPKNSAAGISKKRSNPITLKGQYHINWMNYSNINEKKHGEFKYLVTKVQ